MGLSPRGRGNRQDQPIRGLAGRSIPAWAGKPSGCPRFRWTRRVYPRVGGETSLIGSPHITHSGLSPRGRGNLRQHHLGLSPEGSIPAWAGKPGCAGHYRPFPRVYPRVGGETTCGISYLEPDVGLSPRGRGNRRLGCTQGTVARSIPAWAGKPPAETVTARQSTVYPRVGGETSRSVNPSAAIRGLSPRGRGNRGHQLLGVR